LEQKCSKQIEKRVNCQPYSGWLEPVRHRTRADLKVKKYMLSRKFLSRMTILLLILLTPGHAPAIAGDATDVATISVDRVNQLLGTPDTVIIDVRKHKSWWRTSKKILTAVREDPSKLSQWAGKYTKDQTLIFY
jgi:hypothetical protein